MALSPWIHTGQFNCDAVVSRTQICTHISLSNALLPSLRLCFPKSRPLWSYILFHALIAQSVWKCPKAVLNEDYMNSYHISWARSQARIRWVAASDAACYTGRARGTFITHIILLQTSWLRLCIHRTLHLVCMQWFEHLPRSTQDASSIYWVRAKPSIDTGFTISKHLRQEWGYTSYCHLQFANRSDCCLLSFVCLCSRVSLVKVAPLYWSNYIHNTIIERAIEYNVILCSLQVQVSKGAFKGDFWWHRYLCLRIEKRNYQSE